MSFTISKFQGSLSSITFLDWASINRKAIWKFYPKFGCVNHGWNAVDKYLGDFSLIYVYFHQHLSIWRDAGDAMVGGEVMVLVVVSVSKAWQLDMVQWSKGYTQDVAVSGE